MGKKCVVPKCTSGYSSNPEKFSLFRVPQDKIKIWQKALVGKKRPLTTRDSVCSKHFKPSEIIREVKTNLYSYKLHLPKLSPDAVPSIFHFRGNYQLRRRSSESSELSLKLQKIKMKKKEFKALVNNVKQFETVSEREFTTELHENRRRFKQENSLTQEEYELLVQSVQEDKNGENENSKRYNVIEVQGVKKLITVDDGRQLVHDDGLYRAFYDTHLKIGHYNGYKMLAELQNTYQNISPQDVALFVRLCPGCHPSKFDTTTSCMPLVYNDMTAKCSVNFIDYQTCPDDGYNHLMVYQNHKTKFCLLKPLKSNAAKEIAENIADIFSFIGVSTEIESTEAETLWNDVAFELKRLWLGLNFEHVNALGSHIHWDIQRSLKKWMDENKTCKWVKRLPVLQLEVNGTRNHRVSLEPYRALFGTTANLNAERASSAAKVIFEEVEDPEEQHFETVYSDDYFDEAPVETACEKDPLEAYDTTSNIGANNKFSIPPYEIQVLMEKPKQEKSSHYIFGLLPTSYRKRDKAPKEVQKEFKNRLLRNRHEHFYHKQLTKDKYDELVSHAKCHPKSKYRRMVVRNVDRLTTPGNFIRRKYYVHDDELFDILHYTHINTHHAGRYKMSKTLNQTFANIMSRDIVTYIELCSLCKSRKEKFSNLNTRLHEHTACSELSARCCLSFIDYERQPDGDFKYVMVYENFLTKFVMLKCLVIKGAKEVANHLIDIFTFLGLPNIIESAEDADFIKCVIQHLKFVWPHTQISYHQSEESRNVETITENLKTWMERNHTAAWTKGLKFVQLLRNKDYHCEIQETPYNSLFGFADISCETKTSDNSNTTLRLITRLYPFKNVINSSLTLTTTEDTFKWMLENNRRREPNSASLSKEDYCELVSRVANHEKDTLKKYDLVYLDGAQRLIQPSNTQEYKFYVHDDDLFSILHYIHTHTKHACLLKMKKMLEKHFVNISNADIVTFCELCATCSKKRNRMRKSSKEIAMYSEISSKCCIDIINLESFSDDGFKYVMVYQNLLTNFCILKPLKTRTPHEIASQLVDVLALIGACLVIESREECSFVEKVVIVLKLFYSDLDVKCVHAEHSILENIEDKVKDWLLINETTEWSRALPWIQLAWNRNIHEGMDKSPYEKIFGV